MGISITKNYTLKAAQQAMAEAKVAGFGSKTFTLCISVSDDIRQ